MNNATTMTDHLTDHLIDPRAILDRAIATGEAVIAGVRPKQLTDPTPCSEMNVQAMLAHLVGVLDHVAALGTGDDPFEVIDTVVADDDWIDAWTESAARAVDAWSDDAVLERPMALPWIEDRPHVGSRIRDRAAARLGRRCRHRRTQRTPDPAG